MKLKLKTLLEGYAWERKPGKGLPTLAEVQAEYEKNEAADLSKAKVAKLEKEIADLKHQYYKDSNLSPEREKQLRKQLGEKGRELKRAKREANTGSAGYGKPSKSNAKPDFLDLDKDGDTEEPMKSAARSMNESQNHDMLDLILKAEDMVQNLRKNMATNSVLRRDEKMGYLRAYDELLDILSDIGYQAEME